MVCCFPIAGFPRFACVPFMHIVTSSHHSPRMSHPMSSTTLHCTITPSASSCPHVCKKMLCVVMVFFVWGCFFLVMFLRDGVFAAVAQCIHNMPHALPFMLCLALCVVLSCVVLSFFPPPVIVFFACIVLLLVFLASVYCACWVVWSLYMSQCLVMIKHIR